jgi:hypothetical protein
MIIRCAVNKMYSWLCRQDGLHFSLTWAVSAVQGEIGVFESEACAHKLEESLLALDKVVVVGVGVTGA